MSTLYLPLLVSQRKSVSARRQSIGIDPPRVTRFYFLAQVPAATYPSNADDDLPDVSEWLAGGQRHGFSIAKPPRSDISLPTHLHRMPVRATTFEGRTFYMKRKTKVKSLATAPSSAQGQRIGNLLDMPVHRMMEELSLATVSKLDRRYGRPQASEDITLMLHLQRTPHLRCPGQPGN